MSDIIDVIRAADLNSLGEVRVATVHRGLDPTSNLLTQLFRSFDGSLVLRLCGCAERQERGR